MQINWESLGIAPANILLPHKNIDLNAWAVVACDQYTSEPEYWQAVEKKVGEEPSTLRITLPEVYLNEAQQRLPGIYRAMEAYLREGVLKESVQGFILTRRTTQTGNRLGLMAAIDLEQYDYRPGAQSMVRATEGTIEARLPARVAIRREAVIESPHVMCLMDDPLATVIEPIYEKRGELPLLYDFALMMNGGHLTGWAVTDEKLLGQIAQALKDLKAKVPFLYAVGDGNHSLATAKKCWEEVKAGLSSEEQKNHPARYALAEIENIHCEALGFEPIHRLLIGVRADELWKDWQAYCEKKGMALQKGEGEHTFQMLWGEQLKTVGVNAPEGAIPVGTLQMYLDDYLSRHPGAEIDYIHGEEALMALCAKPDRVGFILPGIDKGMLFTAVHKQGALPRKTFSMGEAHEKRYYMECRRIR
ncbi:MAG: DUF1015 domain-containing protein [Clostridia bacterium]|nr:DUF1015 domain-containing protein [Clostridia bacterium]